MSLQAEGSVVFPFLIEVRKIISEELPIDDNMISLDIVVVILAGHYTGKSIQVKSLLSSLPHSKTGIRYSCKKLLDDGWICKTDNSMDARVKLLVPSEKLMQRCSSFLVKLVALSQAWIVDC